MQRRHLHHKQNRRNALTDIFQLTQGAAVSQSVWTPDCYAHTCLSGRWQNKLPSSEMCVTLGVCVCMYVCVCDLDTLLIR